MLTVIRKDLAQHWGSLLLLVISCCSIELLMVFGQHEQSRVGALQGFDWASRAAVPLAAALVAEWLVAREYRHRTMIFLAALPLSRRAMFFEKLLLGACVLGLIQTVSFSFVWSLASSREPLSRSTFWFLVARAVGWASFVYAFFFSTAFLGRYRVVGWLHLLLLAVILTQYAGVELVRGGPFDLVSEPTSELAEPLAWAFASALALLVLAYALSHGRDGSIPALLGERMSARETAFMIASILAVGLVGTVMGDRKIKHPFRLQDDNQVTAVAPGVMVQIGGPREHQKLARDLATACAALLFSARTELGLGAMPKVFVIHREDVAPDEILEGKLSKNGGVVFRARYDAIGQSSTESSIGRESGAPATAPFDPRNLVYAILRSSFAEMTRRRSELEPKRWIFDGAAMAWAQRTEASLAQVVTRGPSPEGSPTTDLGSILRPTERDVVWLRALYALSVGDSGTWPTEWLRFVDRVGEPLAAAVALTRLWALERLVGSERLTRLLAATVASPPTNHIGALFEDTWDELLQEHTGTTDAELDAAWRFDIGAARTRLSEQLDRIPRLRGQVENRHDARKLRFDISFSPGAVEPRRVAVLFRELGPFETDLEVSAMWREEIMIPQTHTGTLTLGFLRGERLAVTFRTFEPRLGCDVFFGTSRRVLE